MALEYKEPSKEEDGLRVVRCTRDKKKVFVQLNNVVVSAASPEELTFEIADEKSQAKITAIDDEIVQAAHGNSNLWFGKQLTETAITKAYEPSLNAENKISADRIAPTRVYDADQEVVAWDQVEWDQKKCKVILEYSGAYFAKKVWGGLWNIVQVKLHHDPVPDYPEGYMFVDEDEE